MKGSRNQQRKFSRRSKAIDISGSDDGTFLGEPTKKIKPNSFSKKLLRLNPYQEIPFLPEIKLTKEDMLKDPVAMFLKYQDKYKKFGAVKVTTAPQWKSPFCFKYTDKAITTRIQKIHKLRKGRAFQQNQGAYNIKVFQDYATKFQTDYRYKFQKTGQSKESQLQNEYWNLVNGNGQCSPNNPSKYKVTIEYAADLPATKHGSGFPLFQNKFSKDQHFNYKESHFNLNNLYKSPGSILGIAEQKKEFISGVTIPWVYMGMQFSTFCWHVEDLWLNSVNYSHSGAIKTWYVVPEADKEKFDAFVNEKTGRSDLLDRITFMLDPLQLLKAGIRVYKTYQRPGDYVCTFFKAYHAGFSQGFNVGEAVNFVSPKSLNIIRQALRHYERNKDRKPSVLSLQWLIHENAMRGNTNQIRKQYDALLQNEMKYLKSVLKKYKVKNIVELDTHCKYDKNSCTNCREYLFLSSLKCLGCEKNYCQKHLHDCCGEGFSLVSRIPFGKRKKNLQSIKSSL